MIHTKEIKILSMQKLKVSKSKRNSISDPKVDTRDTLSKSNEKVLPVTAINNISSQESTTGGGHTAI